MIYQHLFDRLAPEQIVRAGVIGTGHFATAMVTQAESMARLDIPAVADLDVTAARRAFERAGVDAANVAICQNKRAALDAIERGKRVIVEDAALLMELPIDVIVESTGNPEAGARHALLTIQSGKHVVMVNKETDVTVGPILARRARQAGVVYTPVDGDQHGLLIQLVQWARELGLEVLCAGKARDSEFVYSPTTRQVGTHRETIPIAEQDLQYLAPLPSTGYGAHLAARTAALADLSQVGGFDLVEMAIVANATGLPPDRPFAPDGTDAGRENGLLHCPPLTISEIPMVFCPKEMGGILGKKGVVDCVTVLRQPHEAGLVGGVWIVVSCENGYSQSILTNKGALPNPDKSAAVLYRPYHLCGVEAPLSILCAGLLGVPTGVAQPTPVVDVVARAGRDLQAGERIGDDHSPDLQALMQIARPVEGTSPLPLHMGNGNRLHVDVPVGANILAAMVAVEPNSTLWALRKEQDEHFFG